MNMNNRIYSLLLFLTCVLCETNVHASGRRGQVLTKASVSTFKSVTAETILSVRPRYIGSTAEWHLFMLVRTSFGGGRPFSTLFTYKIAKKDLQVIHAWEIKTFDRYVEASSCPTFKAVEGKSGQIEVPAHASVRERCLGRVIPSAL